MKAQKPLKGSFHYKEDIVDLAKLCYDAALRKRLREMSFSERMKYRLVRLGAKLAFRDK